MGSRAGAGWREGGGQAGPLGLSWGSGWCLQGAHVHAGQAEPGGRQLLARAVLVETDVEEEVARVEEEEGSQAGRLACGLHLWEEGQMSAGADQPQSPQETRGPAWKQGQQGRGGPPRASLLCLLEQVAALSEPSLPASEGAQHVPPRATSGLRQAGAWLK